MMFTFVAILLAIVFNRVFGYEPDKDWQYWVIVIVMTLFVLSDSIKPVAN